MSGACAGATIGFWTVRLVARQRFLAVLKQRFPKLYTSIDSNCHALLMTLRLSPIVPFSVVHGFMAVTQIGFLAFLGITFLGSLLYSTLWVFSGWLLREVVRDPTQTLLERWDVLLGLILLSLVPILLKWQSGSKRSSSCLDS